MKKKTSKFIVTGDKKVSVYVKNNKLYKIGNSRLKIDVKHSSDGEFIIDLNGKKHVGEIHSLKQNQCVVIVNGNTYNFCIETDHGYKRSKKIKLHNTNKIINLTAPLPGLISDVFVSQDQKVAKDEPLFTLEAMKMQNEIKSPLNGVIKKLSVNPGDNVSKDQIVLELENI